MIYKQFEYQYTHAEIFKKNLIRNSYMLNLTVLWNFQQGSNFIAQKRITLVNIVQRGKFDISTKYR